MAHIALTRTTPGPNLAGRPPFATDDDDGNEIYSTPPAPRRVRQHEPNPNSRTSAYNMYDQYLDDSKRHSGAGALGMGFMNGDIDSDDDEDDNINNNAKNNNLPMPTPQNKHTALAAATHPQQQTSSQSESATTIPLASPRPGYAANPIAALEISRSSPAVATPEVRQQQQQLPQPQAQPQMQRQMQMHMPQAQRQVQMQLPMSRSHPNPHPQQRSQMSQLPRPLRIGIAPPSPLGPPHRMYNSSPSPSVPSTPHPLEAPITPITPAFLRPSKSPIPRSASDVKFANMPVIMRSNSEDHLLPKRGDKGDDFWRRFSMVAKEDSMMKGKESTWLRKTQNGTTRLSRWVWLVGVILAICIAGGIGVGWYFGHNSPPNQQPVAIGGSAEEGVTSSASSTSSSVSAGKTHGSSSPHVTPTNTVARRFAYAEPTGPPAYLVYPVVRSENAFNLASHRRRHGSHVNRIPHGY